MMLCTHAPTHTFATLCTGVCSRLLPLFYPEVFFFLTAIIDALVQENQCILPASYIDIATGFVRDSRETFFIADHNHTNTALLYTKYCLARPQFRENNRSRSDDLKQCFRETNKRIEEMPFVEPSVQ